MNQGNFFESEDLEIGDAQLNDLKQQLQTAIQRAKDLARSCKVGHYEENEYQTDACGVSKSLFLGVDSS